jgi:uncharacterized protein YxeA
MKKLLFVLSFVLALVVTSFAGVWTDLGAFNAYKDAKNQAAVLEAAGNTMAAPLYVKAADIAGKAGQVLYQACQLDRAGYVLINVFKTNTNYSVWSTAGKPTTEVLQTITSNIGLLTEANTYLTNAKVLDQAGIKDKIQNNLDFITYVTSLK